MSERRDTISDLLDAIAAGGGVPARLFTPTAVLDATVPEWRFAVRGPDAISAQLSQWYADPAAYEDLQRTPITGGELVRFLLTWTENGVPHAAHQAHIVALADDGRISGDHMFCGGRWDAGLLARMEEAERVHA